jgi:enamine deaminase RidA (YjgF/YER057c/UK114 family)
METQRRSALKKLALSVAGIVGLKSMTRANTVSTSSVEKEVSNVVTDQQGVPVYSDSTKLGNLLFLSGVGAHFKGDIKSHAEAALKELETQLVKAGSTMEKVLKVNVYLNDIADFEAMNSVYKGKFGPKPPVRTTVAVAKGGLPGENALIEIDCIAYI